MLGSRDLSKLASSFASSSQAKHDRKNTFHRVRCPYAHVTCFGHVFVAVERASPARRRARPPGRTARDPLVAASDASGSSEFHDIVRTDTWHHVIPNDRREYTCDPCAMVERLRSSYFVSRLQHSNSTSLPISVSHFRSQSKRRSSRAWSILHGRWLGAFDGLTHWKEPG